ncbi:MAG: hypothetical protein IIZ62_08215 [Ruminococcus sp.]|nr:hypothetical protein [Ruminococcus sp.]
MEKRVMSKKISIIKRIKEAHNLPNDFILDLVTKNSGSVSESTLKRILADGSEEQKFQYAVVADLYNALTLEFGEDYKADDPAAIKAILSERNRWIDRLAEEIETIKEDFSVRELLYEQRKENYEKTIELQKQTYEQSLALLRERIEKQDIIIEKLLDAHLEK